MSYSFGNLSTYVDQQRLPLITKAVFGAKTASLLSKQVGIKSAANLNLMDTDAPFQSGTSCGWNASGTTTFSARTLTVGAIKIQEALCPRSLEQYWMQTQLTQGSNYTGVPFEQAFAEQKAAKIAAALETAIWQGSTATSNTNIQTNKFDGFNTLLNAASGTVVSGNVAAVSGAITASNVIGIFQQIYTRIPVEILNREDLVAFCGWDTFRLMMNAFINVGSGTGNFHYTAEGMQTGEQVFPGTNLKVVAVNGLNSTSRIVTSYLGNMFYGTDLLSDEEQFSIWHSRDNDEIRFQAAMKAGVQIAYPEFVVDWKLA